MSSNEPVKVHNSTEAVEPCSNNYGEEYLHLRKICEHVHAAIKRLNQDRSSTAIGESLQALGAHGLYAHLKLLAIEPGSNPAKMQAKWSFTTTLASAEPFDPVATPDFIDCMLDCRLWAPVHTTSMSGNAHGHVVGMPVQVEARLSGALVLEKVSTSEPFVDGEIALLTLLTDALGPALGAGTNLLQLPILNHSLAGVRKRQSDDSSSERTSKIIQHISSTIWSTHSIDVVIAEVLSIIGRAFRGRMARLAIKCQQDTLHCYWLETGQYVRKQNTGSTTGTTADFSTVGFLGLHTDSSESEATAIHVLKIAQLRGWQLKTHIQLGTAGADLGFLELYTDEDNPGVDRCLVDVLAVNLAVLIQSFDHAPATPVALESRSPAVSNLPALDASLELLVSSMAKISKQVSTGTWSVDSLSNWLAEVAQSLGASYAIIGGYLQRSSPVPYVRTTWRSSPEQPVSFTVPRTTDFEQWTARLSRGESIWACRDELVDPVSRDFWSTINCGTGLLFPLIVRQQLWGWVFFEYVEQRPPESLVMALLETAVAALANRIALDEAKQELERSSQLSLAAVADEKIRLSRDIHDTVTQEFLAIMLYARAAQKGESVSHHLQVIEETARLGVEDARRSIESLRSGVPLTLPEMIEQTLHKLLTSNGLKLDFTLRGHFPPFTNNLAMEVRFIVEEALRNVIRHAHATELRVLMDSNDRSFLVAVTDNGVGFDTTVSPPRSYGLLGMQERAAKIGGLLEVESVIGLGTRIILRLEYPEPGNP